MAAFTHVHRLIPIKILRLNTSARLAGVFHYLNNEKRSYRSLQFNLRFVYEVVVNADFIGHRHADKRVDFQRKTPKTAALYATILLLFLQLTHLTNTHLTIIIYFIVIYHTKLLLSNGK